MKRIFLLIILISPFVSAQVKQFIWKEDENRMAVPYLGNGKNLNLDSVGVYSKAVIDSIVNAITPDTSIISTKYYADSLHSVSAAVDISGHVNTGNQGFGGNKTFYAGIRIGPIESIIGAHFQSGYNTVYLVPPADVPQITVTLPSAAGKITTFSDTVSTLATQTDIDTTALYATKHDAELNLTKPYFFDDFLNGATLHGTLSNTGATSWSASPYLTGHPGQAKIGLGSDAGKYFYYISPGSDSYQMGWDYNLPGLRYKTSIRLLPSVYTRYYAGLVPCSTAAGINDSSSYYDPQGIYFFSYSSANWSRTVTCTTTTASDTIKSSAGFGFADISMGITGNNITSGTYVRKYINSSTILVSQSATGTASSTLTISTGDTCKWFFIMKSRTNGTTLIPTNVPINENGYTSLEFILDATASNVRIYVDNTLITNVPVSNIFQGSLMAFTGAHKIASTGDGKFAIDYVLVTASPITR